MDLGHRGAEIRPATRGDHLAGYPFRQRGKAGYRAVYGASQSLRGQTAGERVDRFQLRHVATVFRADHMVGMRHLWFALSDLDAAADDPPLSGGKHAAHIIVARVEKDDLQPAAFVLGDDAPRTAGSRRRLVMLDHQHLDSGDAAIDHLVEGGACASVDQADRKVAKQVDDMRANPFLDDACEFRTHARQHGGGGKQAKNLGGTFRMHGSRCSGPGADQITRKLA